MPLTHLGKSRQRLASVLLILISLSVQGQTLQHVKRADGQRIALSVYPANGECQGNLIISPGAGGSELGYRYLASFFASNGWQAVVVGHQESGVRALLAHRSGGTARQALQSLVQDGDAYRSRLQDIAAAQKSVLCPAKTQILLGHSMGAATSFIAAGANNLLQVNQFDQFDAYIALSPTGVGAIFPEHAWQPINKPFLLLTGTRDATIDHQSYRQRTSAYADLHAPCTWLGVIKGANHMNFAGRQLTPDM
ncbi:MAG: alpha/beta hydrolase, partial [Burkholderiales bacterium]|nr:alpha/beta hydrolase [Burkholderiales bacterium]